ncbi:hypothetical protein [Desulfococcus multivorans]|uniref:Uncharacterized protein n=1 Tax=Desulfococcus multivorans DSM 2059 TaxID=1121405 RepID=S7U2U7_DESML|nr:hypothetical protein [Desulfococcus multivorans]AOY59021.1 uncharacterized protein Dmul_22490 [Desulfococcus multivorans]EPR43771.1 hypothetical protein dsmv_1171 [Desulfococcus multivorans DSM 2059]SJZ55784.1 hypothetical protein SAMN02745446_00950 [Desulfococcus multivorans DSM 2059]
MIGNELSSGELVPFVDEIGWQRFEDLFGATYCPDNGRLGVSA